MPYSSAFKNAALNTWRNVSLAYAATYVSAHTASPGDTGANEVSGGSPAYARKLITWNAASGGTMDSSNVPEIDIPAGTGVTHLGYWDAVTAGVYLGYSILAATENFAAQGILRVLDADPHLNA